MPPAPRCPVLPYYVSRLLPSFAHRTPSHGSTCASAPIAAAK
ncbi:hypothetical protein BIFANG_02084 [Bifidobacterium angulatum DSM 20098 = JCM 7096]|uniref:Uncharacterized protein n=1 Tax=Bifidobacterium angulatum DSM 20098 = JCM 7096 TaxID=518635 RepID=C4FCQ8_9BIFI|nr:hypothetical protein BIFANG_02084 [Bifidobacterium angulatum DSM 20098 = JCM 7096]